MYWFKRAASLFLVALLLFSVTSCGYSDSEVSKIRAEAHEEGRTEGYEDGYTTGYDEGYDEGYDDGHDEGYEAGKTEERLRNAKEMDAERNSVQRTGSVGALAPSPSPQTRLTVAAAMEKQASSTPAPSVKPSPTTAPTPVSVTVYITKSGEKYHRSGCQYLKKSKIEISLDDAKAKGYTACSKCNPPK